MGTPAEIIRETRTALKMSPQELADKVGVSRSTIYGWENGVSVPARRYYPAIADALHLSIDTLFSVEPDKFDLTETEKQIIRAYRSQPEMQLSVRRLLGIDDKK